MRFISSASLGSQNISSSLLSATFTATAVDAITTRLFAAGISGSANYLAFVTLQRLGTGSTYQVIPVTSASVELGTTAIALITIPVPVDNTDVLKVYLQGSASDTSSPSLWTYFYAESTCILLADSALTAAAIASSAFTSAKFGAGAIGADILGASALTGSNFATGAIRVGVISASAIGASNIGGSAFDSTVFKTNALSVGVLAASVIGASNIGGSAFDSTLFKAGAIDVAAIATSAITSDEFAQSAADKVWSSSSRTLTQGAASIPSALSGSSVTLIRGDSLSLSVTSLGSIADRSELWFTVKRNRNDGDTSSLLMVTEGSGLKYANQATATASHGDITVDNAAAGNITITATASPMSILPVGRGFFYDIQVKRTTGSIATLASGPANIEGDVTAAVT